MQGYGGNGGSNSRRSRLSETTREAVNAFLLRPHHCLSRLDAHGSADSFYDTYTKALQLRPRGLDGFVLVLSLLLHELLIASPVHSPEAFSKNGVRVVEARVEPVGVHAGQVLDLKLEQRGAELLPVAEVDGERVYLVLAWT